MFVCPILRRRQDQIHSSRSISFGSERIRSASSCSPAAPQLPPQCPQRVPPVPLRDLVCMRSFWLSSDLEYEPGRPRSLQAFYLPCLCTEGYSRAQACNQLGRWSYTGSRAKLRRGSRCQRGAICPQRPGTAIDRVSLVLVRSLQAVELLRRVSVAASVERLAHDRGRLKFEIVHGPAHSRLHPLGRLIQIRLAHPCLIAGMLHKSAAEVGGHPWTCSAARDGTLHGTARRNIRPSPGFRAAHSSGIGDARPFGPSRPFHAPGKPQQDSRAHRSA